MKKITMLSVVAALALGLCFAGASFASDEKGPADITMVSTIDKAKKAKPAIFPHAKHQEKLKCADCHHSKDADGKQVAYVEGQKIEKCETCHNKAAAAGMSDKKLKTFKGAAHMNCKGCHKASEKAAELKKKKCALCHPKKK
jgi:hypothetical protein